MPAVRAKTPVYLQEGRSRVFACALDWPGWCRRAKTAEAALEALADYAARYAPVVERAGYPLPAGVADRFEVVETIPAVPAPKFSGPDFGVIDIASTRDSEPVHATDARRLADIVEAAWAYFEDVVAGAPQSLRKGPRGGGRDRGAIYEHVVGADAAYARKIGLRREHPNDAAAVAVLHADMVSALRAARAGEPMTAPPLKGWSPRYAARRIAWHALDHAWEIEDRSQ